jgi:hypothetical protein
MACRRSLLVRCRGVVERRIRPAYALDDRPQNACPVCAATHPLIRSPARRTDRRSSLPVVTCTWSPLATGFALSF